MVVFLLMILLTLVGTFSQKTLGLYESLRIYFISWIVPREGWLLRLHSTAGHGSGAGGDVCQSAGRRRAAHPEKLAHHRQCHRPPFHAGPDRRRSRCPSGTNRKATCSIFEGESSNRVQAFQDWVLEVREPGGTDKNTSIIHETAFRTASPQETTTFHRSGWPFELKVSGYQRNATITTIGDPAVLAGAPQPSMVTRCAPCR